MMHRVIVRSAMWVLSRLAPAAERAALLGDLMEEYTLRAAASSPAAALRWCLRQVFASAAPLIGITLTRSAWLSTGGVALLAWFAVGAVELMVNAALGITSGRAAAQRPLGLAIAFPLVILIGYCAAAVRRRAPAVLGVMMLAAVTLMAISTAENLPLWYHAAYFAAGPAAAFIGSLWYSFRHRRS